MLESEKIEKITNKIYEYVTSPYCNNCRYNREMKFEDKCDFCHRKNMNWDISREFSKDVAKAIYKVIK